MSAIDNSCNFRPQLRIRKIDTDTFGLKIPRFFSLVCGKLIVVHCIAWLGTLIPRLFQSVILFLLEGGGILLEGGNTIL